ncbi:MAG: cytochrome-c peroxidase [Chitinophagales bacterium]
MKNFKKLTLCSMVVLLLSVLVWSCQKDLIVTSQQTTPYLPTSVLDYSPTDIPDHFNGALPIPFSTGDNSINSHSALDIDSDMATLGRVLFYDNRLSLNNTISCASCHKQANGFADPVASSRGFKGKMTPRNSMTIVNPIMNNNLFWDSRASSIRGLVLEPVQNHIEMGMESIDKLSVKLSETSFYPELFQKAYGTEEVTEDGIADALMQFLMSMMSYKSKWDVGIEQNFENFNALETMGRGLFFSQRTQCSGCHSGVNFSAPDGFGNFDIRLLGNSVGDLIFTDEFGDINSFGGGEYFETQGTANIGLDVVYADQGRGEGNFKIPSLRNIGLTAPYMHDGRFNTLEEVIDHYDQNVQPHTDLDTKFKSSNGIPKRMDLSQLEKRALEAFLNTLTDDSFVKDVRFSDPFLK